MRLRRFSRSFLLWAGSLIGAVGVSAQPVPADAPYVEPPIPNFDKALAALQAAAPALADEVKRFNAALLPLAPYGGNCTGDIVGMSASPECRVTTYCEPRAGAVKSVGADALAADNARLSALTALVAREQKKRSSDQDFACASNFALSLVGDRVARLSKPTLSASLQYDDMKLHFLEGQAAGLEAAARTAASPAAKQPLRGQLTQVSDDAARLLQQLKTDGLNIDDDETPYHLDGNGAGPAQLQENALQKRMAALIRRLQAVDKSLNGDHHEAESTARQGTADVKVKALARSDLFGTGSALGAVGAAAGVAPAASAATGGGLLALKLQQAAAAGRAAGPAGPRGAVPLPSSLAQAGQRSPVNAGADQANEAKEDAAPQDTAKVDALRAKGATRTVGDPGGRAAYVFHQTGNTCAMGAQLEVSAIASQAPPDPAALKEKESRLYALAVKRGWFTGSPDDPNLRSNGGTSVQYIGDFLDVPVTKQFGAKQSDLDGVVKTGRMAIVGVDSGRLYNDPNQRGLGHFVTITGVETDRAGNLLGYYINDTGMGEGGRFVAASQFIGAWKSNGAFLVVPQ